MCSPAATWARFSRANRGRESAATTSRGASTSTFRSSSAARTSSPGRGGLAQGTAPGHRSRRRGGCRSLSPTPSWTTAAPGGRPLRPVRDLPRSHHRARRLLLQPRRAEVFELGRSADLTRPDGERRRFLHGHVHGHRRRTHHPHCPARDHQCRAGPRGSAPRGWQLHGTHGTGASGPRRDTAARQHVFSPVGQRVGPCHRQRTAALDPAAGKRRLPRLEHGLADGPEPGNPVGPASTGSSRREGGVLLQTVRSVGSGVWYLPVHSGPPVCSASYHSPLPTQLLLNRSLFRIRGVMASIDVPMYDPRLVQPMREELTRIGFQELRTPDEVDAALATGADTALVVVNSVCGCAARNARPAATLAVRHARRPNRLLTVFAGQDADATARARSYFTGYPPSSPQMALFKSGRLVYMLERKNIEGRVAQEIAADLVAAFERYCS